jgi:outer membrane protein OmpA-like peptidoglycan-associated protein
MRKRRQTSGSAASALALALGAAVAATALTLHPGLIEPAQAQDDDRRKGEPDRQRQPPSRPQPPPSAKPPPSFKAPQPPPSRTAPPPPPRREPLQKQPAPERPAKSFQQPPPPAAKVPPAKQPPAIDSGKERLERRPPPVAAPPPKEPPAVKKAAPPPAAKPPAGEPRKEGLERRPPPVAVPPPKEPPAIKKAAPPGPRLERVEDVRKGRQERVEEGGRRRVISEPGKRIIVKERDRSIIRHDEAERFLRRPGAKSQRRPDGTVETSYLRPDGVRIVTVVDRHGRLLRRFRRHRDGREHHIIDNRRFYRRLAPGAIGIIALDLAPPHVTIPLESYIVDYESASDDLLYETLEAPPVEDLERAYSLDEVLDTYQLRARMRRIDLATITFDSGAWQVPPEQYDRLERVARAILRVLRDSPEAVFLIEGHTDAVGSEDDNLSLSDRRAEAVAEILTETFDVPPENLVTQGYGEQHLKIATEGPEPRNRRVAIINISPLMAER